MDEYLVIMGKIKKTLDNDYPDEKRIQSLYDGLVWVSSEYDKLKAMHDQLIEELQKLNKQ